ncbi:hypothetical protein CSB37_03130 [bacterium DOLZORAL124_38_8]|nr:MAG: hypothetical protein CSB37_03130 [bacterium DOLZORAL124_38_8]
MALQDILKKVLEEASKKVSAIELETKEEISLIQSQIEALEKEELDALKEEHAARLLSVKENSETNSRRKQKQIELAAKCSVLESALDSFYAYLVELSDNEYESILKVLASGIEGSGKVLVPANRLAVTKNVLNGFEIEESSDIKGGFIFKGDSLSVDNSFKNIVYSEYKTAIESFFAPKLGLI